MRTFYAPTVTDGDLRKVLDLIESAAHRADPFTELEILHVEPKKLRAGMVVYADGTDWNPGSGQGIYRRNVANGAWVFLG